MRGHPDKEALGKRIRAARDAVGLTQAALADAAQVRPHTMWRYEAGRLTPSADVLDRISNAVGRSSSFLLNGVVTADPGGSGIRVVEEFLASDDGARVAEEHVRQLRSIRFGGVQPTVGMVRSIWLEMVAQESGRLVERPKIEPPVRRPGRVAISSPASDDDD